MKYLSQLSLFLSMGLTRLSFSLETKPWFGDQYAFDFEMIAAYSRYHTVEGAAVQLSAPKNDRNLLLDLSFTPSPQFDLQTEVEFGKTNPINWALRSAAFQGRYQMLNDIAGDPFSLSIGFSFRGATAHFLKDVGTPYAACGNGELFCSAGKEWSQGGVWTTRIYGFLAIGQANRGYPWTRELFVLEKNWEDTHRLALFTGGYFGFGNQQHIDVNHFDGWGKIQHQSIDVGFAYGYHFNSYGTLSASYSYRLFAHNFPQRVNSFLLSYCVPFSLF